MTARPPFKVVALHGLPGCLLPLLIVGNLFFGWLFLKFFYWILLECVLILLFRLSVKLAVKKATGFFNGGYAAGDRRRDAIDVEATVLDQEKGRSGPVIGIKEDARKKDAER